MASSPRFIYVVSRERRELYERLRAEFQGHEDVAVVLDRRRGERRRSAESGVVDLRRGQRRKQRELDAELVSVGYFITACDRLVLVEVL